MLYLHSKDQQDKKDQINLQFAYSILYLHCNCVEQESKKDHFNF